MVTFLNAFCFGNLDFTEKNLRVRKEMAFNNRKIDKVVTWKIIILGDIFTNLNEKMQSI